MALTSTDLVLRVDNTDDNIKAANSLASYDDIASIVKFRFDAGVWSGADIDLQIRAMVSAYNDIKRLRWGHAGSSSQSRDYEFSDMFDSDIPQYNMPFSSEFFSAEAVNAQAAQTMFILNGTQVRDMAREGVNMSTAFSGSEIGIGSYQGAVCVEAKEILIPWLQTHINLGRG